MKEGNSIQNVSKHYKVPIKNLLRWMEKGPERQKHSNFIIFRRYWKKKIRRYNGIGSSRLVS